MLEKYSIASHSLVGTEEFERVEVWAGAFVYVIYSVDIGLLGGVNGRKVFP